MKRFVVSTMVVSLAFIGAGAVVDKIIAGRKSDDKALDIIAKARAAIGGDAALAGVRSFVIKGQTSKTISINGAERFEQANTEIVYESNRLMKMIKMGDANAVGEGLVDKQMDIVVVAKPGEEPKSVRFTGKDGEFITDDGKTVTIRRADGAGPEGETRVFVRKKDEAGEWTSGDGETKVFVRKKDEAGNWVAKEGEDVKEVVTEDGKKFTIVTKGDGNATFTSEDGKRVLLREGPAVGHGVKQDNELLRTMLSLFLTAPEGMDVSYRYAGATNLDGVNAEAVVAAVGGSSVKLFFDASSYLPLGMSYVGHPEPMIVKLRRPAPEANTVEKDVVTFERKLAAPEAGAEYLVRFADYRNVNGLMLPYKWSTTIGGKQSDVFDVSSYELNPANLSERFKGGEMKIRVKK